VIGGTIGVLAGVGILAIPGLGPFIAAGPIMVGLAGLGVGGAVGGLVGALIGMGIPEYEAKRYEGHVKNGGNLLSVHCDTSDQIKRAKDLLKSSGALDIASTSESSAADTADEKDSSDLRMTSGSRYGSGGRNTASNTNELGNTNGPPYTAAERRTSDRRITPDRRKTAGLGNASASPTHSTPTI
jgi:hypothetical protein